MNPKLVSVGFAFVLAVLAGCQKRAESTAASTPPPPKPVSIEVVKEQERSRSFLAVTRQLELGGTLYGYVDVDGDVLKVTGSVHEFLTQLAQTQPGMALAANLDLGSIATTLGLTDIKAIGLSSVPDGTGFFRNRAFFYTPGERHGLMLGLGGKPGPFTHLKLAPADTAFYSEADLDIPAVYRTLKEVVVKVAGEPMGNQMEDALKKSGEKAALSIMDLIGGLRGHSSVVLRVDPERTIKLPGKAAVTLPAFSLVVAVDGIATAVEPALTKSPAFKRTEEGALHVYQLAQPSPVPEIQPVLVADGTTLYFATSRAFLDECRSLQTGLAQTPEFQKAVAHVGTEGNGITYVAPRFFDQLRRIPDLNPALPQQVKPILTLIASKLPKVDRPLVGIRTNLPDGILVRSYLNRSMKQDIVLLGVYNPVTLGLLAGVAIPAFQKTRTTSQDMAIMTNLRQLAAAADQYYLEHHATTTTLADLVGEDKYVRRLMPVMGEDYSQLKFVKGQPLRLRLPNGRILQYPMTQPRPRANQPAPTE